jgi:hypothetical protein
MQLEVERNQAPKDVDRVDGAHTTNQKPHVHFKDGTALNFDGTSHHGIPRLTNAIREWLLKHGWKGN